MTATQQHRYEVWASTLLFLTFAVSLVADFLLKCGYFAPTHSTSDLFKLYLITPFLLYVYYLIRQGVRGAKTFFLVCYAFALFHLVSDGLSPTSYDTPLKATNLLVQHGFQVVACALLLLSLRVPETKQI